jgi:putative ABC transport system permease protein
VVGVAADIKNYGLEQDPRPQLYLSFPQIPWTDMNLLVRTAVPPEGLISAVRAQVAAVDSDQPVTHIQTVDELMDNSRSQPRFTMLLLAVFSATALALAVIGIYGVLSYSVAQRRQEFGIRLALGAAHADILRMVVRQGLTLAALGVTFGLLASFALTRLISSMLYKVGAMDLATFILTPALFFGVALLASYAPAQRATRVNPVEALR